MFLFMFIYCGRIKGFSGKCVVITFYALREIYVSLLSSQQWAFISTTLDKKTSSYLVSFSGVVSVASAVGGCTVEQLVTVGGVRGLLFTAFVATVIGFLAAESANSILATYLEQKAIRDAERRANGIGTPYQSPKQSTDDLQQLLASQQKNSEPAVDKVAEKKKVGFWQDSWNLICSHHILQLLFFEAITHQTCTNMLNIMFHNGLRYSTMADTFKAKLVGRFFATVNIMACLLQVFLLPIVLSQPTLPKVLKWLPFIVFLAVMIGVVYPGLVSVMLGFGTMKVLEYSIMHSASEMIYMPLGHEVRYVGKELVKFFGHKLGKSGASLLLSVLISNLQPSLRMQSVWGGTFTMIWAVSIFFLANHLIEREEKDEQQNGEDDEYHEFHGDEVAINKDSVTKNDVHLATSTSMPIFEIPEEDPALEDDTAQSSPVRRQRADTPDDETTTTESESPPSYLWFNDSDDGTPQNPDSLRRDRSTSDMRPNGQPFEGIPVPLNEQNLRQRLISRSQRRSPSGGRTSFYANPDPGSTNSISSMTSSGSDYYSVTNMGREIVNSWVNHFASWPIIGPFVPRVGPAALQNPDNQRPIMLKVGSQHVSLDSLGSSPSLSRKSVSRLQKSKEHIT